jgi:DNA-binding MarR family transcriptional regulator
MCIILIGGRPDGSVVVRATWDSGGQAKTVTKGLHVDDQIPDFEYEQMLLHRHALASYGRGRALERSAYLLLSRIQVQGPMSLSELVDALGLEVSTLNRQTAAAMRAGVLQRGPDPAGGRARKFALTGEGGEALKAAREQIQTALRDLLADWPEDEIETFTGFLRRFNMDIERRIGQVWPRP